MKAILINDGTMSWEETAIPNCKDHEILIKVKATAVNRADLAQKIGLYPPPPGASQILGLECSGVIEKIGKKVKKRKIAANEQDQLGDTTTLADPSVVDSLVENRKNK